MEKQKISLKTPADLVVAIPAFMQRDVSESVVVVNLENGRRFGGVARFDIDRVKDGLDATIAGLLDHGDTVTDVLIVVFASDQLNGAIAARQVGGRALELGLNLLDTIVTDGVTWWNTPCDEPDCDWDDHTGEVHPTDQFDALKTATVEHLTFGGDDHA